MSASVCSSHSDWHHSKGLFILHCITVESSCVQSSRDFIERYQAMLVFNARFKSCTVFAERICQRLASLNVDQWNRRNSERFFTDIYQLFYTTAQCNSLHLMFTLLHCSKVVVSAEVDICIWKIWLQHSCITAIIDHFLSQLNSTHYTLYWNEVT